MASVRKRQWVTKGTVRTCWVADYFTGDRKRHLKSFKTRRLAADWLAQTQVDVAGGKHTPESGSVTVAQAAALWLTTVRLRNREVTTCRDYESHLRHILPLIGAAKLARLTTPGIESFADKLRETHSTAMARKLLNSLKGLLKDAQRRGLVAQNVALPVKIEIDSRDRRKLQIGVDIPTKEEIPALLAHAAHGRARVLLTTAVFTGMRASELRGLAWSGVDFDKGVIRVSQRVDRYNEFGKPKSASGDRTIPLAPPVRNALLAWREVCPKSHHNLVFPNGGGGVQDLTGIYRYIYNPAQIAAGIVDAAGKPKYSFHSLRHFFASWLIDQGFKPKKVQALMGHANIAITMDRYTHLFPDDEDDAEKFALGSLRLLETAKPLRAVVA